MKHRPITLFLAALFALTWIVALPQIARANTGVIHTVNDTKEDVWITIYDLGRTRQIDYGRVAAGDARTHYHWERHDIAPAQCM